MVEADERIQKQIEEAAAQARAAHTHINLHVPDRVAAQQEHPHTHKVQDLKHLLGAHAMTEEGMAILRERKKFKLHQGALYHCHTLRWTAGRSSAVRSPNSS